MGSEAHQVLGTPSQKLILSFKCIVQHNLFWDGLIFLEIYLLLVSQYWNEVNFMVNKGCEEYSFWVLMLILKETSNYDRGCKVHSSIPLLPCPKFMNSETCIDPVNPKMYIWIFHIISCQLKIVIQPGEFGVKSNHNFYLTFFFFLITQLILKFVDIVRKNFYLVNFGRESVK